MTTMTASASGSVLIAHQGGWDEIAMIGVPVLIIATLLGLAKRRVDAMADSDAMADDETANGDATPSKRHG